MADDAIRNRILEVAQEQFFRFGFSRVTMSEIAGGLGMSKRTLYAYFPGKEDILASIMDRTQFAVEQTLAGLIDGNRSDAVEKLGILLREGSLMFSRFNQQFLLDIQRNAPGVWKKFDDFRREKLGSRVTAIVREGMASGHFRRDINPVLVMLIHSAAMQAIARNEVLAMLPLSAADVYASVHQVIFEGILTDEARRRASQQNNRNRQEDAVYV